MAATGSSSSAPADSARAEARPNPADRPVAVGVIGLGFMGPTHLRAYKAADAAGFRCSVIAVSDRREDRLSGAAPAQGNIETGAGTQGERLFDPAAVRAFLDPRELLGLPEVEVVSICTPTDTHVELALAALEAGKHVLLEKPVALRAAEVRRVADAANSAGRLCMPAMCMRFWPGWDWLHDRVQDRAFGRVLSATFQRVGSPPTWNPGFYRDFARSGGALFDLHIHDADMVRWCFGPPKSIASTGTRTHITTLYRYDAATGPAHVSAEGGQDSAPGFGFRMRYTVTFEQATADWDISRTPPLLLSRNGQTETIPLPPGAGYEYQARHIVEAVRAGWPPDRLRATMEEAVAVTEMLEKELAGLDG